MLEVKDISLALGEFHVKDISFRVERGAYFVLLGESGAGKSVVLEIITGLLKPEKGGILLDQREISRDPISSRGIGLVYQDQSLFPHMSVRQNIAYPLRGAKRSRKMIEHEVEELAEKVGITRLLSRSAASLSQGEAQRTALARALATHPKLLLLDEPLASLDVTAKTSMRSLLRELNRDGLTIVHVTHDYKEAISLASRLAVLEKGTIVQCGTPEEVFDHPKSEFIARFTGVRNFYKGSLWRASRDLSVFKTAGLEFDVATDEPDGNGYLLLRTRDIVLSNSVPSDSQRNHFKGEVTDVEPARLGVEVTVDIGVLVTASVTDESMAALDIRLGQSLWINFKATATRFVAEQT